MLKSVLYASVALAALTGAAGAQPRLNDENVVVVATRVVTPVQQVAGRGRRSIDDRR